MLSRRVAQQSLKQLTSQQALRFASPASIALGAFNGQQRYAATQTAANDALVKQRLHRPVAPHLSIYKPQITWYLSSLNRITGIALSGLFYLYGGVYLIAPYLGWHVGSTALATSFAAWPIAAKFATKFIIALPFTFHSFNGLRHLVWDTASMITNKAVNTSGWTVVGLTLVSALGLALW